MKKKTVLFIVLVLLFLVLLTNGLQGEEIKQVLIKPFRTGNEYLEMEETYQISYTIGLMDMLYNQTFMYDVEYFEDIREVAGGMSPKQISAIFDKYLEEHPEKWNGVASAIFCNAINELVENNKAK